MATKQDDVTGMSGIESGGLVSIVQGMEKGVQAVTQKGITMDPNFEQKFRQYTQQLSKGGGQADKQKVYEGLTGVVQQGEDFRVLVGQLNVELARYFNAYQDSLGSINETTTFERIASIFMGKTWLEGKVYNKMLAQPIDAAAGQMLSHGRSIANVIAREETKMEQAFKIVMTGKLDMDKNYKAAQEGQDKWTQVYDGKVREYNELSEKLQIADPKERGDIQSQLDYAGLARDDAQQKRDQYGVVLKRITEDTPEIQQHLDSYKNIIKDLKNMRTNIQTQVLHYQNVLPLVKKVIESTMAVKGADMFGEQIRASVKTASMIVSNAQLQIADTAAKMMDSQNMTPEEFNEIAGRLEQAARIYDGAAGRMRDYVQRGGDFNKGSTGPQDSGMPQ